MNCNIFFMKAKELILFGCNFETFMPFSNSCASSASTNGQHSTSCANQSGFSSLFEAIWLSMQTLGVMNKWEGSNKNIRRAKSFCTELKEGGIYSAAWKWMKMARFSQMSMIAMSKPNQTLHESKVTKRTCLAGKATTKIIRQSHDGFCWNNKASLKKRHWN